MTTLRSWLPIEPLCAVPDGSTGFVLGCFLLALLAFPQSVAAQSASKRVTALTVKGEVVEGVLKSATDATVTIEVAGQPIQIPLDTLQYLSFVGPLAPRSSANAAATRSPMDDAFAAIADLKSAAEVGVLRTQWADRILACVPRVRAFTRSPPADEWPDVKAALEMAIDEYDGAINNWGLASFYFSRGSDAADFAKDLAAKPEERSHRETPAPESTLRFGVPAAGRLGFGDTTLAAKGYSETFSLSVEQKTKVLLDLDCVPVGTACDVVVTGPDGKVIDDRNYDGSKFEKSLPPGTYKVQVTTDGPGKVGLYKLVATARK